MKNFLRKLELPEFVRDSRLIIAFSSIAFLTVLSTVVAFFINRIFGVALLLVLIVDVFWVVFGVYILAKNTNNYAANLSYRIKRGEQEAMIKMPLGILLYDESRHIQWVNPYLQLYLGDKDAIGKTITAVDRKLGKLVEEALEAQTSESKVVKWGDHQFEMVVQDSIGVIYLLDITRYADLADKYRAERLAIGQIFVDNYDELSERMHDQELARTSTYLQTTLNDYAKKFKAYLKRIDEDHFLLLAHLQDLEAMEEDKFSVLDKIRLETSRNNTPLTLSVGIAYGGESLRKIANQAQANLDLALGRGGDQVVLRELGQVARFYGGKSNPMEKRTRVRARMVSQALGELFKDVDQVFVQGHQRPDMDSVGSGIGVVKIARLHGAKAHFLLDTAHCNYDVDRLVKKMQSADPQLDLFVSPDEANAVATDNSLLVMVDHSKYSITYDQRLYDRLRNRIVVIDHHRRGEEFPENPMLTYVEPYASSASELVTEMVEYQQPAEDNRVLTNLEATAMLAGITVDTKEFSLRTGTRTFDAASYLRSIGADSSVVSELLKEDISSFLVKSHLVASLQMLRPKMAVMQGPEDKVIDPILTAQAADMALDLEGVSASFAITRRSGDKVGISARSMGHINVQVIMEKLGGGGHLSNAATQIKDITVKEASQRLLAAIDEYLEENS
ncbi:DHH family phosphoesterase [Lactobacillus delbrueckii]|uniref:DHH family phosphoesterase n=1 Tax=Lactobacillus delbrueckii TaxID=1584 RepID=UPI0004AC35D8|nr:DHH family phosphoesterase [Lactobacillus delbrueckii]MCD5442283.1 DHH family phosphoesterase [Lactobacillus delbrueckii subsp. lactis]MCD5516033.1 DHH family phosphoesterase [Lactobacillus delbrueckii subsp. lactis]MCD5521733.1 DHH family phosphoesterase [Lactobacillus delbrueckii subsp. lactis]MCD5529585.1 DHH family phosphoesterase [Lactobacillus delbrueckii subsp. lactis]MCD5531625.1 DHH family phosphoesterase [Lactobacillus delbrueckii subsp. lactis]